MAGYTSITHKKMIKFKYKLLRIKQPRLYKLKEIKKYFLD
jgi:hypothetical protein